MAYTPNPTDANQPTDTVAAGTAAAEFRTLKAYLNGIVAAGLPSMTLSEGETLTVVNGAASWRPNFFDYYFFR